MTQRQRRARAQRSGAKRRKMNAAVVAWRKMNPGKKLPAAVRVKRLQGGGFSVTPVKMNARRTSFRLSKKDVKKYQRMGMLEPGPAPRKWRRITGVSKSGRSR